MSQRYKLSMKTIILNLKLLSLKLLNLKYFEPEVIEPTVIKPKVIKTEPKKHPIESNTEHIEPKVEPKVEPETSFIVLLDSKRDLNMYCRLSLVDVE